MTVEITEELLAVHARMDAAQRPLVKQLGDAIGYGRLMQLAEQIWREKEIEDGFSGAEHTTGPCAVFMVPCPHPIKDENGHCDICCGAGRITKGVAELLHTRPATPADLATTPLDTNPLADNETPSVIRNAPETKETQETTGNDCIRTRSAQEPLASTTSAVTAGETAHSFAPDALAIAEKITGSCTCHSAYKDRKLIDPGCAWHEYADDIAQELHATRAAALEGAAKECESREAYYKTMIAGNDHEELSDYSVGDLRMKSRSDEGGRCAIAIRTLAQGGDHE